MMNEIIEENPDKFIFIRNPEDVEILKSNKNLVGMAYGIENGAPLEGNLDNIKFFADLGVNYITLAHSKVTIFLTVLTMRIKDGQTD